MDTEHTLNRFVFHIVTEKLKGTKKIVLPSPDTVWCCQDSSSFSSIFCDTLCVLINSEQSDVCLYACNGQLFWQWCLTLCAYKQSTVQQSDLTVCSLMIWCLTVCLESTVQQSDAYCVCSDDLMPDCVLTVSSPAVWCLLCVLWRSDVLLCAYEQSTVQQSDAYCVL